MEDIFYHNGIPLIIPHEYNEAKNSFSILVGNNGVGKSRLLSSLSNSFIEYIERPAYIAMDSSYEADYFTNIPKVITVSTSPFDTFKLPEFIE